MGGSCAHRLRRPESGSLDRQGTLRDCEQLMEVEFVEGRLAFLRGGQLGSTFDRWKLGGPKSRSGVRGRAQPEARRASRGS